MAKIGNMLEPEYAEAWNAWRADQTPTGNATMLRAMQPIIEGAAKLHTGSTDPITLGHGRRLTLEGLRRYDPARGKLQTHLYSHLRALKRINAQQTQGLKVPERIVLERRSLDDATDALTHELGREPSDAELTDHLGISARRLTKLRSYHPGVAEGTLANSEDGLYGAVDPVTDRRRTWHELVYEELSPIDQKVMEYTLGMNGRAPVSNIELAKKLRMTPSAVTQRKAKIQALLDQDDDLSPFGS